MIKMTTIPDSIKICYVLFVTAGLQTKAWTIADKDCAIQVNGCSTPFRSLFPYKKVFEPACIRHDVCYRCGSHYNWLKTDCDHGFLNDMHQLCKDNNNKRSLQAKYNFSGIKKRGITACRNTAYLYYAAVRIAGFIFYRKKSPDWCDAQCVKQKGQPNLPN